jgi:cytochrome P450
MIEDVILMMIQASSIQQDIQQKLRNDIARRASGDHHMICGERQRPFVEAVVLEALRLHPPAHYLLAHTTDKDVSLGKYVIPKGSVVNFGVATIGRDETSWTDPDVFRPERFMEGGEGSGVHCTSGGGGSSRPETMKMIPFGAGRRACPGAAVAMTVLQSFVEDLVMRFEWKRATTGSVGESVDMTEKLGIITEMKVPLQTHLVVRQNSDGSHI